MKMITIAAAAMALAATPAFAATQARASYERSSPTRDSRSARSDLGASYAGPDVPESHQGDPADSLYRQARAAMNRQNYTRAAELFRSVSVTMLSCSPLAEDGVQCPTTTSVSPRGATVFEDGVVGTTCVQREDPRSGCWTQNAMTVQ